MASIIRLHPKVREKVSPQMSAASLAEYLIMKTDQQETVLHNARYSSPPSVSPHSGALRPIQAYCADVRRPKDLLEAAKTDLKRRSKDDSIRPKAREESLRCVETIELFQAAENAFGLGKLPLAEPPRLPLMDINGVLLSVQPHLLVIPPANRGTQRHGVIMFRPQKAPDPAACRLEETRRQRGEHRRELARYMLSMAQMVMDENDVDHGTFDRDLSFVADIRMGDRIAFPTHDHAARVRAIKAACKQIARLWDSIEPRSSALAKD